MFVNTVNNEYSELEWLNMPSKIYSQLVNKPIMFIDDVKKVFDKDRNSLLQKGVACRWLAYDKYNLCAGRIAAFYLPGSYVGQLGFFECVRDESVAHKLFSVATEWIRENGYMLAEGPVNFGEKDRFWGLMTDGFEMKGLYLDNFNPSYYPAFFDSFGFTVKDIIYTYRLDWDNIPYEKVLSIASWSQKKTGYTLQHFQWEEKEKFAAAIHSIYAAAFDKEKRISHLSVEDILHLMEQAKPLLYEKHFWLAFREDVPIGFILFLKEPGLNTKKNKSSILKGFALATIPQIRGKGVEISLCAALYKQISSGEINYDIMLSGINACTTKMNTLIKKIGGELIKVHQTFNYKINL